MTTRKPEIPGHRSADEIIKSAAKIDLLINAGMDPELIGILLEARRAWWGERDWPPVVLLHRLLGEPSVKDFDELLYAAIRKRVRKPL